jgi:DNA adenine methylase
MTFLKWMGSKNQLLEKLSTLFPDMKKIDGYSEPFIGGGSVFFYLERTGQLNDKYVYISDTNENLINTYKVIRNNFDELIPFLDKYQNEHNEELYYKIRDNYHLNNCNNIEKACQFIYLNKTGFNGMWRVNSDGVNNQSIGHKEKVNLYNYNQLKKDSIALQCANIGVMSYENVIKIPNLNNFFCFLDPPYDDIGNNNFVGYSSDGFKIKRNYLFSTFKKLDEMNCKVMMTNASTPWIQSQFKDYNIEIVKAKRMCAGKSEDRVPVDEVVITNYKPEKKQYNLLDF